MESGHHEAARRPGQPDEKMKGSGRKHKTLSMRQKLDLIACRDGNTRLTYAELQDIAFERWKIRPSMGALSRLFRPERVEKVKRFVRLAGDASSNCRIRERASRVHGLNEALAAWARASSSMPGVWVSDDQLIAKARYEIHGKISTDSSTFLQSPICRLLTHPMLISGMHASLDIVVAFATSMQRTSLIWKNMHSGRLGRE